LLSSCGCQVFAVSIGFLSSGPCGHHQVLAVVIEGKGVPVFKSDVVAADFAVAVAYQYCCCGGVVAAMAGLCLLLQWPCWFFPWCTVVLATAAMLLWLFCCLFF